MSACRQVRILIEECHCSIVEAIREIRVLEDGGVLAEGYDAIDTCL